MKSRFHDEKKNKFISPRDQDYQLRTLIIGEYREKDVSVMVNEFWICLSF